MESARDKAIEALKDLFEDVGAQIPSRKTAERLIDAMVDLARSGESAHTRAVQTSLDVRGTTGGKATTETGS